MEEARELESETRGKEKERRHETRTMFKKRGSDSR